MAKQSKPPARTKRVVEQELADERKKSQGLETERDALKSQIAVLKGEADTQKKREQAVRDQLGSEMTKRMEADRQAQCMKEIAVVMFASALKKLPAEGALRLYQRTAKQLRLPEGMGSDLLSVMKEAASAAVIITGAEEYERATNANGERARGGDESLDVLSVLASILGGHDSLGRCGDPSCVFCR